MLNITQDPSTYTTTHSIAVNAVNGIDVTPRENTHPTTRSNTNMSTTQGNVPHVNSVNVTPPTSTTTQIYADLTQGMNGNTKAYCNAGTTGTTKSTTDTSSPSTMMDGSVSFRWIFFFSLI